MLGEEFLSLSLDQVCSLISSDKLTVSSEEKVWPAAQSVMQKYNNIAVFSAFSKRMTKYMGTRSR